MWVREEIVMRKMKRRAAILLAAGSFIGVYGMSASTARAANGTASYLDVNGNVAGFGSASGTYTETGLFWSTSNAGTATPTARPTSTQLTIGNTASDFAGQTFAINLDAGINLNGVLINSTSVNVTLQGSSNTHNNA